MAQNVEVQLNNIGIYPRPEWLRACLQHHLEQNFQFDDLPAEEQARVCLADFLESDMNMTALGRLPPETTMLHKEELRGRYVLQVSRFRDTGSISCQNCIFAAKSATCTFTEIELLGRGYLDCVGL